MGINAPAANIDGLIKAHQAEIADLQRDKPPRWEAEVASLEGNIADLKRQRREEENNRGRVALSKPPQPFRARPRVPWLTVPFTRRMAITAIQQRFPHLLPERLARATRHMSATRLRRLALLMLHATTFDGGVMFETDPHSTGVITDLQHRLVVAGPSADQFLLVADSDASSFLLGIGPRGGLKTRRFLRIDAQLVATAVALIQRPAPQATVEVCSCETAQGGLAYELSLAMGGAPLKATPTTANIAHPLRDAVRVQAPPHSSNGLVNTTRLALARLRTHAAVPTRRSETYVSDPFPK